MYLSTVYASPVSTLAAPEPPRATVRPQLDTSGYTGRVAYLEGTAAPSIDGGRTDCLVLRGAGSGLCEGSFHVFLRDVPSAATAFTIDFTVFRPAGTGVLLDVRVECGGTVASGALDVPAGGGFLRSRRVTWSTGTGPTLGLPDSDGEQPDVAALRVTLSSATDLSTAQPPSAARAPCPRTVTSSSRRCASSLTAPEPNFFLPGKAKGT